MKNRGLSFQLFMRLEIYMNIKECDNKISFFSLQKENHPQRLPFRHFTVHSFNFARENWIILKTRKKVFFFLSNSLPSLQKVTLFRCIGIETFIEIGGGKKENRLNKLFERSSSVSRLMKFCNSSDKIPINDICDDVGSIKGRFSPRTSSFLFISIFDEFKKNVASKINFCYFVKSSQRIRETKLNLIGNIGENNNPQIFNLDC